jgi:hypothetical protein
MVETHLRSSECLDEHNEAGYTRSQQTRDIHRSNNIENNEAWTSQSLAGRHVGLLLRIAPKIEETDCKETNKKRMLASEEHWNESKE